MYIIANLSYINAIIRFCENKLMLVKARLWEKFRGLAILDKKTHTKIHEISRRSQIRF